MNILGIIAEYNPFHNGHQYHLQRSKELCRADCVVCVMSGDFVQRGEPALWDKWSRAEMAVRGGADLVLELPAVFAVNSADQFAYGAVKLLDSLGCVTHLSFGSEAGELAPLRDAACFLAQEGAVFQEALKNYMNQGLSFPAARHKAAEAVVGGSAAAVLASPNNILAVEYLKQLKAFGSAIKPVTVAREGEGYNSSLQGQALSSATAIRHAFQEGSGDLWISLPESSRCIIENYEKRPVFMEDFFDLLRYRIRTCDPKYLASLYSVAEGLENKLKKAVLTSRSLEDLISGIKSRRYTQTRVKRLLVHLLLGLTKEVYGTILESGAIYGRILAAGPGGRQLVRRLKKEETLTAPLLTNSNREKLDEKNRFLLTQDILASDLYEMAASLDMQCGSDRVTRPFFLPKR